MNQKEIAQSILEWNKNNSGPNKWNNNPIGRTIKQIVCQSKNWKDQAKWYPSRNELRINMAKNQGEIPYNSNKNKDNSDCF